MPERSSLTRASRRIACALLASVAAVRSSAAQQLAASEIPAGFQSRTADVGAARIHFVVGGKGPPLLLVHGWPESWYEWRKMMPSLATRFTVVAVDLRGMGASSLEPSGYDKKTLATDLHRLMVSLGYARADIVGHDWGGPVAYAYAAQYRDAVDKLVVVEGSPFGPWLKTLDIAWFFTFFRIPGYAESILPGREAAFLRYFYVNDRYHVVPGSFDERSIAHYTRDYARPGRMAATYGLYRTIDQDVRDNTTFAQEPLTIPVLSIGAEKGAGEITFSSARAVATHVTPVLFHATGHFIPEERPDALVATIEDFIDGKPVAAEWSPAPAR
jgi:pimeloyl-ACP methyl ester carboxylesterase